MGAKEILENYHKQILKFAKYYCWHITLNQELEELWGGNNAKNKR